MSRVKIQNCQLVRSASKYCLYLMRNCLRISYNYTLLHAIQAANESKLPLLVVYFYDKRSHSRRQRIFLLEGLIELQKRFAEMSGVLLKLHACKAKDTIEFVMRYVKDASEIIMDLGYLREERRLLSDLKERLVAFKGRLTTVESNLVVPVEVTSTASEYAARTIRPKIWQHARKFIVPFEMPECQGHKESLNSLEHSFTPLNLQEKLDDTRARLEIPASTLIGGEEKAKELLKIFIYENLKHYDDERNYPGLDRQSKLSPYLHFGMISPVEIIRAVEASKAPKACMDSFIEELLVRRELSFNLVWYEPDNYDSLDCIPDWAKITLEQHKRDHRSTLYNLEDLEGGQTGDECWNAAQMEMVNTGKMHGYMRMYWAKKVIEWTEDYETAYNFLITQNDKYEMDGRDPNGFAGVIWNFGKHDRAHAERPVFGKLRFMNAVNLRRKFKKSIANYIQENTANAEDDHEEDV